MPISDMGCDEKVYTPEWFHAVAQSEDMKAFDAEASETTAYFRSVNATRNEVLEYSDALKQHITDIGIDIIDVDYDT